MEVQMPDNDVAIDTNPDDDNIVNLTASSNETNGRRLRPRNELRNYAESPEHLLNGTNTIACTNFYQNSDYLLKFNGIVTSDDDALCSKIAQNQLNHKTKQPIFVDQNILDAQQSVDSDNSDEEYSPIPSPAPVPEPDPLKQENLRRLRNELRTEEMKLVLLKKLRQSQLQQIPQSQSQTQLPPHQSQTSQGHKEKENLPGILQSHLIPPTILPSGLSITPALTKTSTNHKQFQSSSRNSMTISKSNAVLRGQPLPGRANANRGSNISVPQPQNRLQNSSVNNNRSSSSTSSSSYNLNKFPTVAKELPPSVTITPAPPPAHKDRNSSRDDNQTAAQRQAAAKSALRKQLEKTLLQIPPPKPPAPELHFIPNPSNSEFICLMGLEFVVEYITNENQSQPPDVPPVFTCCECGTDFTTVWKPEKCRNRNSNSSHHVFYHPQNFSANCGKEFRVLCEHCVTSNVKKSLKAEHTNRLKTAFVKALQQEQEIEQNGIFSIPSPVSSPDNNVQITKSSPSVSHNNSTSTSLRHVPTPPSNVTLTPSQTPTPPPPPSTPSTTRQMPLSSHNSNSNSYNPAVAAAAAAQTMQILRGIPISQLMYPYQLALAQASSSTSSTSPTISNTNGTGAGAGANQSFSMADFQRFADMQRQWNLDSIPQNFENNVSSTNTSCSNKHNMNWKA